MRSRLTYQDCTTCPWFQSQFVSSCPDTWNRNRSQVSHKIWSHVGEYGVLLVKRQTEELIQWLQQILSSSVPWNVGNAPEVEFNFQIWYICWCDKLIIGSLGLIFFIFLLFIFYLYLGLTERRRALSSCPTSHLIGWVEMKCCLLKHICPFLALLHLKCLDACFSGQFPRDGEGEFCELYRHTGFYFHPSNGCLCLWSV